MSQDLSLELGLGQLVLFERISFRNLLIGIAQGLHISTHLSYRLLAVRASYNFA
jgi:hypothetical protein